MISTWQSFCFFASGDRDQKQTLVTVPMAPLSVCVSLAYGAARGGGHLARVRYYIDRLAQVTAIELTVVVDHEAVDLMLIQARIKWHHRITCRYLMENDLCSPATDGYSHSNYDLLIIDRVQAGSVVAKLVSCSRKVVVIADTPENPYVQVADQLIDFNYGAEQARCGYRKHVHPGCKLMLGWEYAPIDINDQMILEANRRLGRLKYPYQIMIAMGSEDPFSFTEQALVALGDSRLSEDIANVTVIQGPLFNRDISTEYPFPVSVIQGPHSLTPYYATADLCIATGGVSTWERLQAVVPSRVVAYSVLQKDILQRLHQSDLIELYPDFSSLCSQPIQPDRLKEQMMQMCRISLGSRLEEVITSMRNNE